MDANDVFSRLNQGNVFSTTMCGNKVPVEHLDYGFIEKCTDVKHLEKILTVLRSGDEGIYPHLTRFCEDHLTHLQPSSRALRREQPGATAASLPKEEWSQISADLQMWHKETKDLETSIQRPPMFQGVEYENIPPVRGSNCSVPVCQNSAGEEKKNHSKRALPREYSEWDKFDVDRECEGIDGNGSEKDPPAVIHSGHDKIKTKVDVTTLTEQEKILLASREKDKGNEAFRANDYEEALAYYSRSLSVLPTVAAYNNRAQAKIQLQRWKSAMKDCQSVLEVEPLNLKALLRRATVLKHQGDFHMAAEDLRAVLQQEPQNPAAAKLLTEVEEEIRESQPETQVKGKKIFIQEVEEGDDEDGEKEELNAGRVEPSQRVGGEESAVSLADQGDMGNAQKKPHGGRGDGPPHADARRGPRGGSWDKYRVPQGSPGPGKAANGTGNSRSASASAQRADQSTAGTSALGDGSVNLDAPCGALPPPLSRLKNEGNLLFKNGQFSDALEKYSRAIAGCTDSGIDSPEDLCILYSNRAACYLKDGNSQDCIQDCTRALELRPFSLKPLLRRAMAYDSLERYGKAYVDYKTVLQIDASVQAANDSVNRITRLLIELDGPEWREKLPDIPLVPLSAQQHHREEPPSQEVLQARVEKAAREAARKAEARFTALKQEGNDFVKKGQFQDALGKYTECLKLKPEELAIYTNRALCYLKVERFDEAKQDCDTALTLEATNKKALYRRALANKGLKDYLASSTDLQEVLRQDPGVQEAERELQEVTSLLCRSLVDDAAAADAPTPVAKARRKVPITEVEGGEETPRRGAASRADDDDGVINLRPANAHEFGQSLSAACSHGNTAACAEMLSTTDPEKLPRLLGNQLDGHIMGFIVEALDKHLLETDPGLVYRLLQHLHTTERFSVVLMLLEKDQRRHVTQLFEHLSLAESPHFTKNDVQNLANKYI